MAVGEEEVVSLAFALEVAALFLLLLSLSSRTSSCSLLRSDCLAPTFLTPRSISGSRSLDAGSLASKVSEQAHPNLRRSW